MATKPEAEVEAAPKPKGKKKLFIIIGVVVLVLVLGLAALVFVLKSKQADGEEGATEHAAPAVPDHIAHPPVFMPIENMVVNLADPQGNRFAQVGITLQLNGTATETTVKSLMPLIRNNILLMLARRSAEDMLAPQGKEQLAAEIRTMVATQLGVPPGAPENPIQAVLFSSLIVQ